jgi:hypothetical protein
MNLVALIERGDAADAFEEEGGVARFFSARAG